MDITSIRLLVRICTAWRNDASASLIDAIILKWPEPHVTNPLDSDCAACVPDYTLHRRPDTKTLPSAIIGSYCGSTTLLGREIACMASAWCNESVSASRCSLLLDLSTG